MKYSEQVTLIRLVNEFMADVHDNAINHGFWDSNRSVGESIALIHSELSEALEGDRKNLQDDHLPRYTSFTVELADTIIRIFDLAKSKRLPLIDAILDKHEFNKSRPHKHGKAY